MLPSPTKLLWEEAPGAELDQRSSAQRALGMTVLFEFPGQLPVSGTQLCPPTPGDHSGHLGLSFSSSFPGGAQSSTAGNVLWDLVPPSLSVTEQLHAQNQLGHSCLGPSTSRFSPIPWFTRGGSWHWALTAALGHLGCPARPAPPFPAPASGRCLHQEKFIPLHLSTARCQGR